MVAQNRRGERLRELARGHTYWRGRRGATMKRAEPVTGSAVASEIAQFDALAAQWWNPDGPMRELHRMNPTRIGWISARIRRHFRNGERLRLLDVGCGAGLASEALARRGFDVLGLDAAADAIAAGRAHAAARGIALDYRVGTAEQLAVESARFPVITALEVIEHVADPASFMVSLAALLEPGGLLFVSTLNRTARSLVTAKIGAEYLLRLLPIGTHDWRKFVTPDEFSAHARGAGLRVADTAGMVPALLAGGWRTSRDLGVNYIAMAAKP